MPSPVDIFRYPETSHPDNVENAEGACGAESTAGAIISICDSDPERLGNVESRHSVGRTERVRRHMAGLPGYCVRYQAAEQRMYVDEDIHLLHRWSAGTIYYRLFRSAIIWKML